MNTPDRLPTPAVIHESFFTTPILDPDAYAAGFAAVRSALPLREAEAVTVFLDHEAPTSQLCPEQYVRVCDCGCGQPTLIAQRTYDGRGTTKGQPNAYVRGHAPGRRKTNPKKGPKPKPAPERFWPFVNKQGPTPAERPDLGPCWEWTGARNTSGYGTFHPTWRTCTSAHIWAYTECYGAVPGGLELDHLCSNRVCVNPAHMEPVTHHVNLLRGSGPVAVNAAKTHCIHGHAFTADNTRLDKKGHRRCITCARDTGRKTDARRRRQFRIVGTKRVPRVVVHINHENLNAWLGSSRVTVGGRWIEVGR